MEVVIYSYNNDEIESAILSADKSELKICQACNRPFLPYGKRNRGRLKYCNRVHYSVCPVCGKEFQVNLSGGLDCVSRTCSRECGNKARIQNMQKTLADLHGVTNPGQLSDHQTKVRATCLKKYGQESYSASDDFKMKARATWAAKTPEELQTRLNRSMKTNMIRYGVPNGSQSAEAKVKQIQTNQSRYGVDWYRQTEECEERIAQTTEERFGDRVYFRTQDYRDKVTATSMEKYGVEHFTQSSEYKKKCADLNLQRWGVTCVFQRDDLRKKAKRRTSSLEVRLHNMLKNYHIEYHEEYLIKRDNYSHRFDVFLPKYKILIDVDGSYYHAYLNDPDGKMVRDDYDDVRLYCVPTDYIYIVLVESDFERELRRLQKVIKDIDADVFDYDSELFNWCRSIEFPYPAYDDKYLNTQFSNLCRYNKIHYNPHCEIGISIVNHFHHSIFDCKVGDHLSVKDAWYDDAKLKKIIANRLIYKNTVDPSKILAGFNISKIAPKVSVFNPVLAKHLVTEYLSEYSLVFDPFSGFSGRLLGTIAAGKMYIGNDIREETVQESNQIIDFLGVHTRASITVKDIKDNFGTYPCMLTCPPYDSKEIYVEDQIVHSCDDWIDICLNHFDCDRYVFVVDKTDRYQDYIVEELKMKSHFRKSSEYVIVIDK